MMTGPHEPVTGEGEGPGRQHSWIHRLVAASLSQPVLVAVAVLSIGAVGYWSFRRLPVDAYPDLSPTMVAITTQWPGHAAEEVERLITFPIETEMNGLPKLKVQRSISLYGLSDVRLVFQDGTDPYFARQRVHEAPERRGSARRRQPGNGAALLSLRPGLPLRHR